MNVNPYITTDYENKSNWALGENKPNSNPISPTPCRSYALSQFETCGQPHHRFIICHHSGSYFPAGRGRGWHQDKTFALAAGPIYQAFFDDFLEITRLAVLYIGYLQIPESEIEDFFRIKSAGSSNYRGATFSPPAKRPLYSVI